MIDDPRIGASHTTVPGFDGKRGFGGACFPKDTAAFLKYSEDFSILEEVINSNNEVRDQYEIDASGLMEKAKPFFKKNGLLLNWKEFEKLDQAQKINTLSMIAPITNEEKQKLNTNRFNSDNIQPKNNNNNSVLFPSNSFSLFFVFTYVAFALKKMGLFELCK